MKDINLRRIVTLAVTVLATMVSPLVMALPAAAEDSGCQSVTRTVSLAPGLPTDQIIRGTLCMPEDFSGAKTVDVLVHGTTYNSAYWDWPVDSPLYSYAARTIAAGRATFAYDRLGAGRSSKPLSTQLTVGVDGYVLHQLVGWLRSDLSFKKVDIVGHSFGSIVAINEAAHFNDTDKLVLTGLLHVNNPNAFASVADFYPAFLDPQFAGQNLDPGYLTSVPGTRGGLFYSSSADPAVIAYDEAHKDATSSTLFADGFAETLAPAGLNISNQVGQPILLVVGAQDFLNCVGGPVDCSNTQALRKNEQPYYTNADSLDVLSIPDTGHDIALHPSAGLSFSEINDWIRNN